MFNAIETTRLRLRRFSERDLAAFGHYRQDTALCFFQSWETFDDDALARFWQQQCSTEWGTVDGWIQLAICDIDTDELLGDCALVYRENESVEMGFTLPTPQQGKGIMSEALNALLAYLSQHTDRRFVYAMTDVRNLPSIRLLERLAFERVERINRAGFYKGEWCDEFHFRKALQATE